MQVNLNNTSRFPLVTIREIALPHPGAIKIGPFGSQLKKEDLSRGGYKVYGQENIIAADFSIGTRRIDATKFSSLSSCRLFPGDLVLTMMGTIGKCAIFPQEAEIGIMDSHLLRIQINPEIANSRFVAMIIAAEEVVGRQIERLSHGSIMSGLSSTIVQRLQIPLPPLTEQYRITGILDTIDTQIQHTEQLIIKLKAQKAGILQDLLTRGLDEHGQLRDPIAHPEQFKNSVLGMIPKDWEVLQVGQLAETITSGSRGWGMYYSNRGSLFLRISNLTREHVHLRLHDLTYINLHAKSEGTRTAVKSGDVLISITAELGLIGVIPRNFETAYVNQHIALVRFNRSVHPEYVANYLAGEAGQKQFRRLNDSSAKAGLNLVAIANLLFPLPSIQEQMTISLAISPIEVAIRVEEEHQLKLKLYKKGLLQDLLSGRICVNTEEKTFSEEVLLSKEAQK